MIYVFRFYGCGFPTQDCFFVVVVVIVVVDIEVVAVEFKEGCESKFSHKHHLSSHKKEQHNIEKRFKDHKPTYEMSSQKVKDFKQLRLHVKTHVPNRLLFPCSWEGCDKYYPSNILQVMIMREVET
ncbi:hypothetical protein C1646_674887 [Rhizophagus diaphanus]|nr:hypothetical protein C1646_674887 [Rhizophagus diaphanus] [Rhizophagus sp. MUCL 43196]